MQKRGVAIRIDFDSDFDGNLSMDYTLYPPPGIKT